MKPLVAVIFCLLPFVGTTAFADANVGQPSITRTGRAVGAPAKASSFAPHARSRNHVYGAPLQGKILTRSAPPVKVAPLPGQHKPNSP